MVGVMPFALFAALLIWLINIPPKNDREWWSESTLLPKIEINNDEVTIENFRNFEWKGRRIADNNWENRSYDLTNLKSLDLIVEPFNDSKLMAHTMLAFGFEKQGYVVVSVEARKERHEEYSLVAGALRQFELIYIFGDERDLLVQRAIHRNSNLYLFPIKADRKFMVTLFKDLSRSANSLHTQANFYRTIRDNCTTTLVEHIDRQIDNKIGYRYEILFPALIGELLYDMGYMDTTLTYERVSSISRVDELVRKYVNQPNFSTIIRAESTDPYKINSSTTF